MKHWTDQPTRAPLIAGLIAALLFLTYTPAVLAEPTLSANPTVVTFTLPSGVEHTKLSWSSGSAESVEVYVKIDNGVFTPTGLVGPNGQEKPVGVNYGKTYTFRLFGANGRTIVGTRDVVVTTKLAKPTFETGCALKCITEISVDPHGTFADFMAATNTDATFVVQAFAAALKSDGTCPSAPLAGTLWKPTPSNTFNGQMLHLAAGTLHCFTVTAKDSAGNEQKVHKTFKTHRRFVTVTIADIFIWNDGDPDSVGELSFGVHVHTHADGGAVPEQDIAGGTTIHLNKSYTVADVPTTIQVRVVGIDHDGPGQIDELSLAETNLDIGGPGGPGEVFTGAFTMTSTPWAVSDLKFDVSGTFSVTYAP